MCLSGLVNVARKLQDQSENYPQISCEHPRCAATSIALLSLKAEACTVSLCSVPQTTSSGRYPTDLREYCPTCHPTNAPRLLLCVLNAEYIGLTLSGRWRMTSYICSAGPNHFGHWKKRRQGWTGLFLAPWDCVALTIQGASREQVLKIFR